MPVTPAPKIYHIVHVDRLESIVAEGGLRCDASIRVSPAPGTTIGMSSIKEQRLSRTLTSHPDLRVGDCMPFYFCPRSVMLYVIHRANHPALEYRGGQGPILHLEADLRQVVEWAEAMNLSWAFTTSNAASGYFDDYADLGCLERIDWTAVDARQWSDESVKEPKQAEFLLERSFPWTLVERIGVQSGDLRDQVLELTKPSTHHPAVAVMRDWYY